jgi:prolipoprotein diacylglyceryltransferase
VPGYYHPTFLYESLWCIGVAVLVIWADRRFKLGHGRAFALYVASYCVGRFWIEYMRVDEAHHILGLRLNNWTALLMFLLAVAYIVVSAKKRPGREEIVEPDPEAVADADASGGSDEGADEADGDAAEGGDVKDEAESESGSAKKT